MKLSTKTRYGTRAMLDLALRYGEGVVSTKEIAERQQLSPKYLEYLLSGLQAAGLIRSVRGAQGGHMLARSPQEITLAEIFAALEGTEGFVPCTTDAEYCAHTATCVTQEIWARMYAACIDILTSTTLADLVRRVHEKQCASADMYSI